MLGTLLLPDGASGAGVDAGVGGQKRNEVGLSTVQELLGFEGTIEDGTTVTTKQDRGVHVVSCNGCSRGVLIPRLRFVQDVVIVILCLQYRAEFGVSELPLMLRFLQDGVQVLVLVIIARVKMTGVFRPD